jgi:hypothetical protein
MLVGLTGQVKKSEERKKGRWRKKNRRKGEKVRK